MNFRTIELRDANGDLVCEEPIHQPMGDRPLNYALRCGRAVIHDGQIEGVEVADIVDAVGGSNAT